MQNPLKRQKRLSVRAVAPNVITMLALAAGLTSMKFALASKWEMAVFAIILAGILDGLDGSLARLLKSTSRFGAELDSLADVVNFGVAPALLLYMWKLEGLGGLGWVVAMSFTICCALRLARYNSALDSADEPRRKAGFLTGLPAPVGATLVLIPLTVEFEFGTSLFSSANVVLVTTALVALGLVSRIPTYSMKQIIIPREQMVPFLLGVGLLAAAITVYGWIVLIGASAAYLLLLPLSVLKFHKLNQ